MRHESAPPTGFLHIHEDRGHTVLEFHGEIDIAAATEIAPHLDAVTEGPAPHVVIDLRHVEFFDCSGLRLLHRARLRVQAHDGRLLLVCDHPLTLRILRVTGLHRLLPPAPTLDEALSRPAAASRSW
ncbi:anti-sigma factor antagonist [Streptomyces cavernae]|uniref:anti-sigma factor antagonist n=1 Tax=Streptomyces cavernae TaxID=2259034 RepID=UPI001EE4D5CE|nr:anti-sigma factor antagonist [Streptomyces cavernae]